jgi:hypothetical protein
VADKFWVGGSGNITDNINHLSDSSGGSPGATLPGSGDNVFFDSESNHGGSDAAYTVTVNGAFSCADMSFTRSGDPSTGGLPTLAGGTGSPTFSIYGSLTLCASMTFSYWGTLTMKATSGTKTITSNGVAWNCNLTFDGVGGTFQFEDNLTFDVSKSLTLTNGTVDLTTHSTTVTIANSVTAPGIVGAFTFYNLNYTYTGSTKTISLVLGSDITVSNTLTLVGASKVVRILVYSNVLGTARTITCNGTVTCNAVDFRDIIGAGSASWDLSEASDYVGICPSQGSGITGTTADTMYWHSGTGNGIWSIGGITNRWFLDYDGGGGAGRVPLPQDDVVFDSYSVDAAGVYILVDMPRLGRNITFAGDNGHGPVANSPEFRQSSDNDIYGSLTLVSGMSRTGNFHLNFVGTDNATLTTAGISLYHILVNKPGATLSLGDDLTTTALGNRLENGTFDFSDHNLTAITWVVLSGTTTYLGNGIIELSGDATGSFYVQGGSTVYAEGSTIRINHNSTTTVPFDGGARTYNNLEIKGSASYITTITGSNIFASIYIDASQAPKQINFTNSTTTTVSGMTYSGPYAITFRNSSATTKATLAKAGAGTIDIDYIDCEYITGSPANRWNLGVNSALGVNNTNVYQPASRPSKNVGLKPSVGIPINWNHPITKGLIGCWLLNEKGGLVAYDIVNRNDGTLTGVPVQSVGQYGRALLFDGDDYVVVPNSAKYGVTPFSIFARVFPVSSVSSAGVFTKGITSGYGKGFALAINYGKMQYVCGNSSSSMWITVDSQTLVPTKTWSSVLFTYANSLGSGYINGILDNTSVQYDPLYVTDACQIGTWRTDYGFFKGAIDCVFFWNRRLSASEARLLDQDPWCFFDRDTDIDEGSSFKSIVAVVSAFISRWRSRCRR